MRAASLLCVAITALLTSRSTTDTIQLTIAGTIGNSRDRYYAMVNTMETLPDGLEEGNFGLENLSFGADGGRPSGAWQASPAGPVPESFIPSIDYPFNPTLTFSSPGASSGTGPQSTIRIRAR